MYKIITGLILMSRKYKYILVFQRMGKLFCSRFPLMRPSLYDDEEKKRMKKQKKEGKHRTRAGGGYGKPARFFIAPKL